jgi:hypothetical protein
MMDVKNEKNTYISNKYKSFLIKLVAYFIMFMVVISISLFTDLPKYFDSYIQIENYNLNAHMWLIVYRLIMYFSFPFVISFIEKLFFKRREEKFTSLLIDNFNVQFASYAVIAALYAIFGIDKILSTDIFGNADTFLFMTGFIFTTIIKKGIPDLIS